MPATPGVSVEETSFVGRSIEGLGTTTTAFIGPTRRGPAYSAKPTMITSVAEFERIFGAPEDLRCTDATTPVLRHNYVAHAARAFFDNGGTRLYVLRVGSERLPQARSYVAALDRLRTLPDVAIVAAPGYSVRAEATRTAIERALVAHVELPSLYRIALLDPPPAQDPASVIASRTVDSSDAALYYPWLTVRNPRTGTGQPPEIDLPPSGFMAGIYGRCEIERGVHKAPSNEIVRGALRCERDISNAVQEQLNPLGINCLRSFVGRGLRVWGARTLSSDPEWKYVNVRRYFNYVQASVERGTQWVVFEPNGEPLWARLRAAISEFLLREWRNGALLGSKPEDAFFVRCDRSTMTQNDIDNGRLVCLAGLAALKPAEFVIIRFGMNTADVRA